MINKGVLGDYVELIRRKNKDLITDTLVGVDINKNLIMKSWIVEEGIASSLKLMEKGDFVMNGMHVARDKKIPVALYTGNKSLLTSSSYYVFRVKDSRLIPEYLNLLLKSEKIDQIGLYFAEKDIRGKLRWDDFLKLSIFLPPLEFQQRVVNKYKTLEKVIQLKKEINEKLERWMQSLFHVLFDELKEYTNETFGNLFQIIRGGRPPRGNEIQEKKYFCKQGGIPWLQVSDITKKKYKFIGETIDQLTPEGFKKGRCTTLGGGISSSWVVHLALQSERFLSLKMR